MVSTLSKDWRQWPTPPVLEDTIYDNHHPIGVIKGLMLAKEKGNVWFHTDELQSAGQAWFAAAKCETRDTMLWRDFMEQSKKFAAWWRQIMDEQAESGDIQSMMVESKDWPDWPLFHQAIRALEKAGYTEF